MNSKVYPEAKIVSLPWSNGAMSAKVWLCSGKTIACVPELGLHCYGKTETETLFRLFTVLLKYYRQLRMYKHRLGHRGHKHLQLLSDWILGIEERMRLRNTTRQLITVGSKRFDPLYF